MIKIKRRIGLEPFINREYPPVRSGVDVAANVDANGCPIAPFSVEVAEYLSDNPKYGLIDKSFIYFPILLKQTYDDMGLFTNEEFIEAETLINEELDPYVRKTALPIQNYFTSNVDTITGYTESNLDVVRSYNVNTPYIEGFNVNALPSQAFTGVIEIKTESITYVIAGDVDNVGNYVDGTGIFMETFIYLRAVEDPVTGEIKEIPLTTFSYTAQGHKDYNTSLAALIHEEKYLGVVFAPSVNNDVLIDRGTVNVLERHLKLSEIDTVDQLERYGQGFFKLQVV